MVHQIYGGIRLGQEFLLGYKSDAKKPKFLTSVESSSTPALMGSETKF